MYNFLKLRTACALFSLAILATFIGTYVYKIQQRGYAFTYSVDFTGGHQIHFRFDTPVEAAVVKSILEDNGWKNPTIREFGANEILVRISDFSTDPEQLSLKIQKTLEHNLDGISAEILQTDSVGPGIGQTKRWKSLTTIVLALLMVILYVGWRFWSLSYAAGAIVSLFHDALVIITIFLIFDKEISSNLIAAILMILGYSINDTIVIFSKIRDNVPKMPGTSMTDIVNISLNQTLKRTVLTSVSTALVTLSLIILGGESLRDLSIALLAGVIFGTYSSIYIASPIMLSLRKAQ